MKDIYILQTHTGTIPGSLVKMFTRYKYSHVLLSLDESFTKMYSFGRKSLYNPLNAGFIIEDIDGDFFLKFHKTKCRIYKLIITNKQYVKLKEVLNNFENNQEKYKYDFAGIIPKYFLIPINRKDHFVCSHFVAEVLKITGIYSFNKPTTLVMPKDFEAIKNINPVYVGLLKDVKRNRF